IEHWKANQLDFSSVLYKPDMPKRVKPYCTIAQDHKLEELLDFKLIQVAKDSIDNGRKVTASFDIKNVNRSVGAMLSGKIAEKCGEEGLPEDTITFNFYGSAGQSFGGFAMKGLSLILEGEANDYVGKGLSGGKIIIKTPEAATYKQDENVIAGNTVLYGATSGEVYINGLAGERYAVRNSGAVSVVEGVGDNCCEYMTDGVVVILGSTGRNFAAGMSGGIAYVLDENDLFEDKCNKSIVTVNSIKSEKDFKLLYDLINKHYDYTGSKKAELILQDFENYKLKFKKVISPEYEALTK
ncbi:MAG: glutamate synthase subunit alpha, partial [Bacillota bacterium]|nr:glutamate synthase subunit alpha [Bacillota bacterium]